MSARLNGFEMRRTSMISDCGRYRWFLTRVWDGWLPVLVFVMLNPSTADGYIDDATIRVCIGRAMRMGCGGIEVVNLFAYRATDPLRLLLAADPVGRENDVWIERVVTGPQTQMVIAAWGVGGTLLLRANEVVRLVCVKRRVPLYCLGTTKDGAPRHPLRVAYDVEPTLWREAA